MHTPKPTQAALASRHLTYRALLAQYAGLPAAARAEEHWLLLMAAHVVGQRVLSLHLHSHWKMLQLAVRTGDLREALGQVLRLALAPIGHALGRLPAGNSGRATVNAFAPMRPDARLRALIASARRVGVRA